MASGHTALVTGATGAVGPLLVQDLVRRGYRTRVLVRELHRGMFPETVEVFRGCLSDRQIVQEATKGADVIFHLAAKLHIVNPKPEERVEYRDVNVEGTRTLVDAAESAHVHRFIYFSTIAVYGKGKSGILFDEDFPIGPDSWYAETKAEGEEIVLSRIPGVVLRLGAVYGSRMKGNYPRLVRALARGLFVPIGNGTNRRTVVHEMDVVSATVLAAESPRAVGRVYNITDGQVHPLKAIVEAVCRALNRHPPRTHVPATLARMLAATFEDVWSLSGRCPPIGRATIDKLLEETAVLGVRIQNELGFCPQLDLITGWNKTVAELRRNGMLS